MVQRAAWVCHAAAVLLMRALGVCEHRTVLTERLCLCSLLLFVCEPERRGTKRRKRLASGWILLSSKLICCQMLLPPPHSSSTLYECRNVGAPDRCTVAQMPQSGYTVLSFREPCQPASLVLADEQTQRDAR